MTKSIVLTEPEALNAMNSETIVIDRPIEPQPTEQIYNDGGNRWYPTGVWGGTDWIAPYEVGESLAIELLPNSDTWFDFLTIAALIVERVEAKQVGSVWVWLYTLQVVRS